jgi:hypothetical protein
LARTRLQHSAACSQTAPPTPVAPGGTPVDALASNSNAPPSTASSTAALNAPAAAEARFAALLAMTKAAIPPATKIKKSTAQPAPTIQTTGLILFGAGGAGGAPGGGPPAGAP